MQAPRLEKIFTRLKYDVQPPRKLKNEDGPEGRLRKIQKTLTALIKYERIELFYPRADETRGYAELLIQEAIRYGPENKETMELANFWLTEKQLVHKLFKVLSPRYQNYTTAFTKLHIAPALYPASMNKRAVLELRGNIYPPIEQHNPNQHNLLHNILLQAAKQEYEMRKSEAEKTGVTEETNMEENKSTVDPAREKISKITESKQGANKEEIAEETKT